MRILLIEDEEGIAAALRSGLNADGFSVDVAHDGQEGFDLACSQHYDAIISDIMLPSMNGYRIVEGLRSRGITTPLLMLTAKDGEWDETEGLDLGADDYIVKPFRYPVLLARLRSLLRRSGTADPDRFLTIGSVRLDTVRRVAEDDGTPVDISPKSFAVLAHLVRNSGMVVSKQSMIDNCWGYDYEGDLSVVEVHISRLRQALKGSDVEIQTVRGEGYRAIRVGQQ